jgi:hypothetical protein
MNDIKRKLQMGVTGKYYHRFIATLYYNLPLPSRAFHVLWELSHPSLASAAFAKTKLRSHDGQRRRSMGTLNPSSRFIIPSVRHGSVVYLRQLQGGNKNPETEKSTRLLLLKASAFRRVTHGLRRAIYIRGKFGFIH